MIFGDAELKSAMMWAAVCADSAKSSALVEGKDSELAAKSAYDQSMRRWGYSTEYRDQDGTAFGLFSPASTLLYLARREAKETVQARTDLGFFDRDARKAAEEL